MTKTKTTRSRYQIMSGIDHLQPDKGDVKAATGNIHFDDDKKVTEKKAAGGEAAAPPAQQQETGGDHLEPSKEPSKPMSAHPVMDSSK